MGQAIDFDRRIKVCLNNKRVTHRFVYFEDWIHLSGKSEVEDSFVENKKAEDKECLTNNDESARKYLRAVYFGKYVRKVPT
jgi:hypothetical protein